MTGSRRWPLVGAEPVALLAGSGARGGTGLALSVDVGGLEQTTGTWTAWRPDSGETTEDGEPGSQNGDPGSQESQGGNQEPSDPTPGWTTRLRESLFRPTSLVVTGSMAVGAVIRSGVPRGLWVDEAISVSEARMSFGAMIHQLATADVHPPLYFTILWASGRLIGFGDVAVRVPSIVFGVLLIPLVYLLGKEAYDRRTGAVGAVIVSVAPYAVWYSQEARMYALLMVFGVIALWAQLRVFHRTGWYPWIVYTVASIAMMCTQYFGIWQLLTQQLIFVGAIVVRWRRHQRPGALLWPWLCSAVLILVALVPLALMMKGQFHSAQATGQAFAGSVNTIGTGSLNIYTVLTNLAYSTIGFHSTAVMSYAIAIWPIGVLVALVLLGRHSRPVTYLLVAVVVVPVIAMFVLGEFKASLADIRYLSTTVPVVLVMIARGVTSLASTKRALTLVVIAVVAVMSVALFNQQFSSSNPRRYNFREALHRVDTAARPGDVILYDPLNAEMKPVITYSPRIRSAPLSAKPTVKAGQTVFIVTSAILMDGSDRSILDSALGSLGARDKKPLAHWVFPNVQVWEYR
jgi:4-amino-4-deoxy-L-arabinose transferase-like glycosyltransferase